MPEFLRDEILDFLFAETEVHGLDDELLDGGADLGAAGVDFQVGRLVRNVGADTSSGLQKAVTLEELIDFRDGEWIDLKLCGEFTNRRKLLSIRHLTREDALLELLLELHVDGHSAVVIQEKHRCVSEVIH